MKLNRLRKSGDKEVLLNITPLVDVVFFLLIFLLISTTFIKQTENGIKIDLPTSSIKDTKLEVKNIQVIISANKQLILNYKEAGRDVQIKLADMNDLRNKISTVIENSTTKNVVVSADKNIDYGYVIDVMTASKESGATALDLDTAAPKK